MRPTAGSEAREFTSRAERGRVPPLFDLIQKEVSFSLEINFGSSTMAVFGVL